LKTRDFDYELPPELIAQHPVEPRDSARLLVYDRKSGEVEHTIFREIGRYLKPGDVLVINQTRVFLARLYGRKQPGGGRIELLLLNQRDQKTWEALVGGKGLNAGRRIQVEQGPEAEIVEALSGPRRLLRFTEPIEPYLHAAGHVPLPPYITEPLADPDRYQTVFATEVGSAAAPTAGLHFTQELLAGLQQKGIRVCPVTLHIGLDTFAPVTEGDPADHQIHTEWCSIPAESAQIINQARLAGGRIIAVGTTSIRTLETAGRHAPKGSTAGAFEGPTSLYILPGYPFRVVEAAITNFHLPKSTLIMLVSAFAGREQVLKLYELAIAEGYRFYSFGDAMLIL
jgi:S-adenosylmethionine:tRNA ribosyltransferase-isomerase